MPNGGISRKQSGTLIASEVETGYLIVLTCRADDEAHIRALLLQGLAGATLALRGLDSNDLNGTGGVRVTAHLMAPHRIDAEVEKIVGRISLEPAITAARWEAQAHFDPESRSALAH